MFTQHMGNTINQKIKTLANIMAENMNRTTDQIREDNTRLRIPVVDLPREVQSTVAVMATPTWTSSATAYRLPLISN